MENRSSRPRKRVQKERKICGWRVGYNQINNRKNVSELKTDWSCQRKESQLSPLWQNSKKLGSSRIKESPTSFQRGKN